MPRSAAPQEQTDLTPVPSSVQRQVSSEERDVSVPLANAAGLCASRGGEVMADVAVETQQYMERHNVQELLQVLPNDVLHDVQCMTETLSPDFMGCGLFL